MARFNAYRLISLSIVLFLILMSPNHAAAFLTGSLKPIGFAIAGVTGAVFGPAARDLGWEATQGLRESITQFENSANEVLGNLDVLLTTQFAKADQVATKHMNELRMVIADTHQRALSVIQETDRVTEKHLQKVTEILRQATYEIEQQRRGLFQDFNKLLDEVECIAKGQVMTIEWMFGKLINEIPDEVKIQIFGRTQKDTEKVLTPVAPSFYYGEVKRIWLADIDVSSPINHIVKTYSNLEYLADRVGCAHRKLVGRELYTEEMVKYARKQRLWRTVSTTSGF